MPLPNALSVFRILATPVVMALVLLEGDLDHNYGIAATLFIIAAISDYADGYLARRRGATTVLGAFLDLTADKLLVSGTLLALLWVDRASVWVVFIIIGREFVIMGLRSFAAMSNTSVPASQWGKSKATVQYIAVAMALLRFDSEWGPLYADEWAMIIAAIVTVLSGADYVARYIPVLRSGAQTG